METSIEVKTIVIKPVVKAKFAGISAHSNTKTALEGAQLGKAGYKTGLSKEDEKHYEDALNKPKGFFSKDNKEFWATVLNLSLPNDKPYYFTVDSIMDEIKYKVLLQHSAVANNELELSLNPMALFFIEDKEAKAKVEEVAIDFLMEAQEAFMNLTTDEKKGYLKLYGKKGVENLSDRIIKTELFKEVNKDSKKFLELTKNPDITLRIEIEEMLEAGTLIKKGNYYNFQNEVIGNTIDSVVSYFKDIKNQSIKIAATVATNKVKKGK